MRPSARVRGVIAMAAGVSLIVGTGLSASGGPPARVNPVATGAPSLGTPVLSVRRLPDWIDTATADAALAAGLPKVLAGLGPATAASCLVVTQAGRTIFAARPDAEELPASNMKLLTATAVLDKLGTKLRLRTRVVATGRRVAGVLHGDLYLVGGGDPFLRTPGYQADLDLPEPDTTSLPQLARQVKAAGIVAVDGRVFGDEHLFDAERGVATWKPIYAAEDDVGPLSALDVNDGFQPTKPFGPAAQPAVMAAAIFARLLRRNGVRVARLPASSGVAPHSAHPVTSILSAPMATIVDTVLRVSDDTGAELLTKLLGRRFAGRGSTAAGTRVIRADLARDGLPVTALRNLDGSGLDRDDRVSCRLIVDDLDREGTTGALFAGLPVAGLTGTLKGRMTGTPAAGRLHAKTGTLDGVSALSGFVMPATGGKAPTPELGAPITFSFLGNNVSSTDLGIEVGDAIGVYLAQPPRALPIADARPRPARVR